MKNKNALKHRGEYRPKKTRYPTSMDSEDRDDQFKYATKRSTGTSYVLEACVVKYIPKNGSNEAKMPQKLLVYVLVPFTPLPMCECMVCVSIGDE